MESTNLVTLDTNRQFLDARLDPWEDASKLVLGKFGALHYGRKVLLIASSTLAISGLFFSNNILL